jgi:hypothetical protein
MRQVGFVYKIIQGMHRQQNIKDRLQVEGERNIYVTWHGSG